MDDPDMKYDLDPADLDQGEETKDRRRKFREDEDRALARIHINNNTPATLKAQIQRARNRLSAQRHRQRQKAGIVDLQHEVDREKQRRIAAEAHVHHLQVRDLTALYSACA
ncbi:MAG: hypothetical protein KVP17_000564 [Porospora cf. gigantea B]|uniref:uncharacterized protein n=1 Tax=Porospora cf. gigantea B TaxID=2853592 RepID=UPI003571C329|nr:MAG: hypothetical protein KVP17_000564 [Porospora cf. gigantea B]